MLRWKKYALVIMVFALLGTNVMAQQMTLEEAIATARERSAEAVAARSNFVSSYWSYRTYLADRLPDSSTGLLPNCRTTTLETCITLASTT